MGDAPVPFPKDTPKRIEAEKQKTVGGRNGEDDISVLSYAWNASIQLLSDCGILPVQLDKASGLLPEAEFNYFAQIFDPFLDELYQVRQWRHVDASAAEPTPAPRPSQPVTTADFEEQVAELRLQLVAAARDNPGLQREVIGSGVAGMLKGLEPIRPKEQAERVCDLLMPLLRAIDMRQSWACSAFLHAIPAMRATLDTDPDQDDGWLQTLASLGVLLSMVAESATKVRERVEARVLGAYYYHEVLCKATGFDEVSAKVYQTATNNLAASIGNLMQDCREPLEAYWRKEGADAIVSETTLRDAVVQLRDIAVRASSSTPRSIFVDPAEFEAFHISSVGEDEVTQQRAIRMLHELEMVTSGVNADSIEVALRHAVAGVVRAGMRDEETVASSFFNSGVTLRRLEKKLSIQIARWVPPVTAVLDALGLFWTLALNSDVGIALTSGDGFDCSVNLFAALTDFDPRLNIETSRIVRESGAPVAAWLWAHRKEPAIASIDSNRLANSLQELSVRFAGLPDSPDRVRGDQRTFIAAVRKLIRDLVRPFGVELPDGDDLTVRQCAEIVCKLFDKLYEGNSETSRKAEIEKLWSEIAQTMKNADVPLRDLARSGYVERWKDGRLFALMAAAGVDVSAQRMYELGIVYRDMPAAEPNPEWIPPTPGVISDTLARAFLPPRV